MRTLVFATLLLCIFARCSYASIGDRSPAYGACVAACTAESGQQCNLPWSLRWSRWTCLDECSYQCIHKLTDIVLSPSMSQLEKQRSLPGLPLNTVVQFHGKWPFYRFFGIQEPLSVLFSLANLYMHAKYGWTLQKRMPKETPKQLRHAYRLIPIAGVNLWIWSTVFHTRDRPWTEKLDYFSAALSMICNMYLAVVRTAGLYPSPHQRDQTDYHRSTRYLLAIVLSTIFIAHVSYLSLWRFDYGYNMLFNMSVGMLHNLIWGAWTFIQFRLPKNKRPPHFWMPLGVLTLLSSLTALELLDFPPIGRALDAHALWHASTIMVVKWWYVALIQDARWNMGYEGSLRGDRERLA